MLTHDYIAAVHQALKQKNLYRSQEEFDIAVAKHGIVRARHDEIGGALSSSMSFIDPDHIRSHIIGGVFLEKGKNLVSIFRFRHGYSVTGIAETATLYTFDGEIDVVELLGTPYIREPIKVKKKRTPRSLPTEAYKKTDSLWPHNQSLDEILRNEFSQGENFVVGELGSTNLEWRFYSPEGKFERVAIHPLLSVIGYKDILLEIVIPSIPANRETCPYDGTKLEFYGYCNPFDYYKFKLNRCRQCGSCQKVKTPDDERQRKLREHEDWCRKHPFRAAA